MWALWLNDMRSSHIESRVLVAVAETPGELQDFMLRESIEPIHDGRWVKSFRKGPLEWFNKPYAQDPCITQVLYIRRG